jgi:hypothetical protein
VAKNTEKDVRVANLKKLKLSARQLAERVETKGYSYWQGLLNGSRPFAEKAARSIEDDLGLPRGWLDRREAEQASAPFRDLSPYEAQAVTIFRQLGEAGGAEEQQRVISAMSERLTDVLRPTIPRGRIIEDSSAKTPAKSKRITK